MEGQQPTEFFQGPVYDGIEFPPFPKLILKTDADKRFEDIKNFQVRTTDVLLSTYPKSGTHWVFEILNMLLKGKTEYAEDMAGNYLEIVDDLNELENIENPRVLVTHLPYYYLPQAHCKYGAKVVHVVRNPKDVTVSFYYHLKSSCITQIPWSTYIENVIQRKWKLLGGWFRYEKEYEDASRNNNNAQIHTIFYEDMQMNTLEEVKKLAAFLEVEHDITLLQDIVYKCNFVNMKKANITGIKSHTEEDKLVDKMEGFKFRGDIYRKGKIGDWKNMFTVAQNEMFNEVLKMEMKDSRLKCLNSC